MSTINNNNNNSVPCCAKCFKHGQPLLQCSACKKVLYCNKECQREDRPKHKTICKTLAGHAGNVLDNTATSQPLIYWQEKYPELWEQLKIRIHFLPQDSKQRWVYVSENKDGGEYALTTEDKIIELMNASANKDYYQSCLDLHNQDKEIGCISFLLFTNHPKYPIYHQLIKLDQSSTTQS